MTRDPRFNEARARLAATLGARGLDAMLDQAAEEIVEASVRASAGADLLRMASNVLDGGLPVVSKDSLRALAEVDADGIPRVDFGEYAEIMARENPTLFYYVTAMADEYAERLKAPSEISFFSAVAVFTLLTRQAEADQLNRELG